MQQKNFLIVQGRNKHNETFRPSDWAERLCHMSTVFAHDDKNLTNTMIVPCVINGVKCLRVDHGLQTHNPLFWSFVTSFAYDNDLITESVTESVPSRKEIVLAKVKTVYEIWIDKLSAAVPRAFKEKPDAS